MSFNNRTELIEAVAALSDNANLKICVKQTAKAGVICGLFGMLGGLLMGPVGIAIGGTVGGLTGAAVTSGSFQPVGKIIMNDLTDSQRRKLVQNIISAAASIDIKDVVTLLLCNDNDVRNIILNVVKTFFENDLHMQIID